MGDPGRMPLLRGSRSNDSFQQECICQKGNQNPSEKKHLDADKRSDQEIKPSRSTE